MLELDDLVPTQSGFRLPLAARRAMTAHVRDGGDFRDVRSPTGRPAPIVVDRFPDGRQFVRDGLHRVTAVRLGRAEPVLWTGEYRICAMTYALYTTADVADSWFTPFDPRTEVRFPDVAEFKARVAAMLAEGRDPHPFIRSNRRQYCRARRPTDTAESLALRWLEP
ncbi:hypothetical protein [Lentzea sp. NPDC060358]|uniref:hypothetical protein n=1 Tax=Lentzea sp. NPDC060358 TaxID=3347103 RepID=UPI00364C9113